MVALRTTEAVKAEAEKWIQPVYGLNSGPYLVKSGTFCVCETKTFVQCKISHQLSLDVQQKILRNTMRFL